MLGLVALMLLSGIAIWKPVQTSPLEQLCFCSQGARLVHFIGMALIVALTSGPGRRRNSTHCPGSFRWRAMVASKAVA